MRHVAQKTVKYVDFLTNQKRQFFAIGNTFAARLMAGRMRERRLRGNLPINFPRKSDP